MASIDFDRDIIPLIIDKTCENKDLLKKIFGNNIKI